MHADTLIRTQLDIADVNMHPMDSRVAADRHMGRKEKNNYAARHDSKEADGKPKLPFGFSQYRRGGGSAGGGTRAIGIYIGDARHSLAPDRKSSIITSLLVHTQCMRLPDTATHTNP